MGSTSLLNTVDIENGEDTLKGNLSEMFTVGSTTPRLLLAFGHKHQQQLDCELCAEGARFGSCAWCIKKLPGKGHVRPDAAGDFVG